MFGIGEILGPLLGIAGGLLGGGSSSGSSSGSGTVTQISEGGTASEYQDLLNLFKTSLSSLIKSNPVAPGPHSGQFAYLRPEDIKYTTMNKLSTYKPSAQQSSTTPFQVFQPTTEGTWNGTSGWTGDNFHTDIPLHVYTPVSGATAKSSGTTQKGG